MRPFAVEFVDSTRHSFVVSLLTIALYIFGVAMSNMACNTLDSFDGLWASGVPQSISDFLTIRLHSESASRTMKYSSRFSQYSTLNVIVTSGAVLVAFFVLMIWKSLMNASTRPCHLGRTNGYNTLRSLVSSIGCDKVKLNEIEERCHLQELQLQTCHSLSRKNDQQLKLQKAAITHLHQENSHLEKDKFTLQSTLQAREVALRLAQKDKSSLQTRLDTTVAKVNELTSILKVIQQDKIDMQTEIDRLRYTPPASRPLVATSSSLPSTPFVLVLIDGDAYRWSVQHFRGGNDRAGALASQAIQNEVQVSLSQASNQFQIVARVFCNFVDNSAMQKRPDGKSGRDRMGLFAKSFTESMPLFDFIDAGGGKERADSKIHATYHLFVNMPQCHKIFFAAATDNGFARLLEQYACNRTARGKTILVHPGHMGREVEQLNFAAIEWPSVFRRLNMPPAAKVKSEAEALRGEKVANERRLAAVKMVRDIFGLQYFKLPRSYVRLVKPRGEYSPFLGTKYLRNEGTIEELD